MPKKYYFDTSIWLDHFENRNELHLPKGDWAHRLMNKIINSDDRILYSDMVLIELRVLGYQQHELEMLFQALKPVLIFVQATDKQLKRAKDLSLKRNVPKGDAVHALIARDNNAILVALDKHFEKVKDFVQIQSSRDFK